MNRDEIKSAVLRELQRIAPESDAGVLSPSADIREELDIDSMDFLRFVTALHASLGVTVPEADYRLLSTIEGCVDYLAGKLKQGSAA